MLAQSSPGFDPFPTLFIKRAETDFLDGQGKKQRANVLLPLLTACLRSLQTFLIWCSYSCGLEKDKNYTRTQKS